MFSLGSNIATGLKFVLLGSNIVTRLKFVLLVCNIVTGLKFVLLGSNIVTGLHFVLLCSNIVTGLHFVLLGSNIVTGLNFVLLGSNIVTILITVTGNNSHPSHKRHGLVATYGLIVTCVSAVAACSERSLAPVVSVGIFVVRTAMVTSCTQSLLF